MRCPICQNVDLVMSERQGVEIDYCPQCRGIWLDRGELDKIIERSNSMAMPPQQSYARDDHKDKSHLNSYFKEDKHYKKDDHYEKSQHNGYPKKKEGFLSELFDF